MSISHGRLGEDAIIQILSDRAHLVVVVVLIVAATTTAAAAAAAKSSRSRQGFVELKVPAHV